jgi:hypothetical protein
MQCCLPIWGDFIAIAKPRWRKNQIGAETWNNDDGGDKPRKGKIKKKS